MLTHDTVKSRLDQLLVADRHHLDQVKEACIAQLSMEYFEICDDLGGITDKLYEEIKSAATKRQFETDDEHIIPSA